MQSYLFVFVTLISLTSGQVLYDGDNCELASSGQSGICRPLSVCRSAQMGIRTGQRPQICSFEANVPVVCCLDQVASPSPPPPPPPVTVPQTTVRPSTSSGGSTSSNGCPPVPAGAVKVSKNGQKAWDKCIDWIETVHKCVSPVTLLLNAKKIRQNQCAVTAVELIVGGTPAKKDEFPHMALLGFGQNPDIKWECGGTLISNKWVMTAGHCIYSRESDTDVKYARLGGDNVDAPIVQALFYNVMRIEKHPDYIGTSVYNDIALLELDRLVTFTRSVRPACLHVGNPVNDNKAIATGWGVLASRGSRSNALLKVVLEKFPYEDCALKNPADRKAKQGVRNATQLCAGHHTEIKDTCQGDSGGPLQIYNRDVFCTYTIIGITSTGKVCGVPGTPALYTRVSAFVPWIESVVWP